MSTKRLMFQVLIFILFIDFGHSKLFIFIYFCNFIKKKENKLRGFLQKFLKEIMKKNNTRNIRRLVNDSFVPSSQQPSVLYLRLTDFWLASKWPASHRKSRKCKNRVSKYPTGQPTLNFSFDRKELCAGQTQWIQIIFEALTLVCFFAVCF